LQANVEQCDDGNMIDNDACGNDCMPNANAQCFAPYTTFNAADRNMATVGGGPYCDQNGGPNPTGWSGPGWYRFSGPAGTQMSTALIPTNRCATHAPGWLNGAHPIPSDGIVARTVCFNWNGNQCNWQAQIQVVACPGYYLYNLVDTPVCYLRYCGT
jgi:hypothetical protein